MDMESGPPYSIKLLFLNLLIKKLTGAHCPNHFHEHLLAYFGCRFLLSAMKNSFHVAPPMTGHRKPFLASKNPSDFYAFSNSRRKPIVFARKS